MSSYLYRLARWCFRNRWATVAAWLVVLIGAGIIASVSGGKTSDAVSIPGTEAQQAISVLQAKLPAAAGASTQVVFATPNEDITAAKYQTAITASVKKAGALGGQVTGATDPYTTKAISPDKHVGLGSVSYNVGAAEVSADTLDAMSASFDGARAAGVQVEFGGARLPAAQRPGSTRKPSAFWWR